MIEDSRDALQILRFELNYLEQGGFDRDRKQFGIESPFRGTFACINFGDPSQAHTCTQCLLHQFVPVDKRTEEFPCHYIPLNAAGETIAELIQKKDPQRLMTLLEQWLHQTIAKLETTQDSCSEQ
jgi:hypothetical protein